MSLREYCPEKLNDETGDKRVIAWLRMSGDPEIPCAMHLDRIKVRDTYPRYFNIRTKLRVKIEATHVRKVNVR